MKTEPGDSVRYRLRAIRRRMVAQGLVVRVVRALLISASILVLWTFLSLAFGWSVPREMMGAGVAAAAVFWLMLVTWMRFPRLSEVAAFLDRRGRTHDRLSTALAFSAHGESMDSFRTLALRECAAFLGGVDFRALAPWRFPRQLPWVVVPAIALAALQWRADLASTAQRLEQQAAQAEVLPTIEQLKALAQATEEKAKDARSEALQRLAEQMRRSAGKIRTDARTPSEATKAALRELSALEQLVKEMQQPPTQLTSEEMQALANALDGHQATKGAAEALRQKDPAEAARRLQEIAREIGNPQDAATAKQMQETLQKALERLAQQKQLSEALRQLAQHAAQSGVTSRLLQQLAELLRNAPSQGDPSRGESRASPQSLQSLLNALQKMKFGARSSPQGNGAPQPGSEGDGKVSIQSFAGRQQTGNEPSSGEAQFPTGRPGSERDFGTTDSPFGSERSEPADVGAEISLSGRLGEGESLSQLMPAVGDDSRAQRRYKELYEAMAPAAEQAVRQEDIPLGSRFFIKRYFEAIRPRE